jgi:hypothetical protein
VRRRRMVFVGGTGRSGTTVVGVLLGKHSLLSDLRHEARFHSDPGGVGELVEGRVALPLFLARLGGPWYQRETASGEPRGLSLFVPPEQFGRAVDDFVARFTENRVTAGAELVLDIFSAMASDGTREGFVEMTPSNAEAAPALLNLFPQMKMINVVRSGLDVACSIADQWWGPNDVFDSMLLWGDRLERADAGVRELPRDRVMTIHIEELIGEGRGRIYLDLLRFLEIEDDREMRRFFRTSVLPERARVERWREIPSREQAELVALYRLTLRRLRRKGVRWLPLDAVEPWPSGFPVDDRGFRSAISAWLRSWRWRRRRGR